MDYPSAMKLINAILALTQEVKNISESLDVIASDIKRKNQVYEYTIKKG